MRLGSIVLDSRTPEELADFYAKLLGWNKEQQTHKEIVWYIVAKSDYSETPLVFQGDPDYKEPVWPTDKSNQQQMTHLDFYVSEDEFEKKVDHAVRCGGRIAETQFTDALKVLIDPSGHPFCIIPIPNHVYQQRYGNA